MTFPVDCVAGQKALFSLMRNLLPWSLKIQAGPVLSSAGIQHQSGPGLPPSKPQGCLCERPGMALPCSTPLQEIKTVFRLLSTYFAAFIRLILKKAKRANRPLHMIDKNVNIYEERGEVVLSGDAFIEAPAFLARFKTGSSTSTNFQSKMLGSTMQVNQSKE